MVFYLRVFAIVALAFASAALLAEMNPAEQTAEKILGSRLEELLKDPGSLSETRSTEYYLSSGKRVELPAGEDPGRDLYKLEYSLLPLDVKNSDAEVRDFNIAIHWHPNPNIKQTQTLRKTTPILVKLPSTAPEKPAP